MPEKRERRSQSQRDVGVGRPRSEPFAAYIIECITGDDQQCADTREGDARKTIAAGDPATPKVQRNQGSQNDERRHRGCAVNSHEPRSRAVLRWGDFRQPMKDLPRRAAGEQQPGYRVSPSAMMPTELDGVRRHGSEKVRRRESSSRPRSVRGVLPFENDRR